MTNPVLFVEITSDSTEDYDRGEKLRHYKQLPSVREVLIVSHGEPRLTQHQRAESHWAGMEARPGQQLQLPSVTARVAVDDVYRDDLEDRAR